MALFHAKFACILAISNPVFRWESCKGSMWESVKNWSRLYKETGTRGWILRVARSCKLPEWCTHAKHARSWSVAPAVALQDKSPRLARPFASGLNSRLNPVVRLGRQNTLFLKIWLFTFLLTLLYIYRYTHDLERVSRENFEREILEKTRLTHPQSLLKRLFKFLYSLPLHCQILERLIIKTFFSPYPFLWDGCLVLGETVKKEPISHWLMLWSSSWIQEARKEIGSVQSRWSKKLGGLRYTGRLGLEGLLLFMYPNYIF